MFPFHRLLYRPLSTFETSSLLYLSPARHQSLYTDISRSISSVPERKRCLQEPHRTDETLWHRWWSVRWSQKLIRLSSICSNPSRHLYIRRSIREASEGLSFQWVFDEFSVNLMGWTSGNFWENSHFLLLVGEAALGKRISGGLLCRIRIEKSDVHFTLLYKGQILSTICRQCTNVDMIKKST